MRYLKSHPIHENDSHLSDMTIIKTKADATIVPQERESDGNEFQRLSRASKVKTDVDSTYKMTGQGFQKLSSNNVDVTTSKEDPKVDGSYQRLQSPPKVESPEEVTKIHTMPEDGNDFQKLSDAPEKDNVSSTYKQNDSELNQRLSDIAASESKLVKFSNFK